MDDCVFIHVGKAIVYIPELNKDVLSMYISACFTTITISTAA